MFDNCTNVSCFVDVQASRKVADVNKHFPGYKLGKQQRLYNSMSVLMQHVNFDMSSNYILNQTIF